MAKALQLGRYHLLDRIAFGGMAEIYRAKTFDDRGRVHMVAVKRILSHLARDDEFIKMLVDEARIASLMEHDAIAKVYEFCHVDPEYFIAMEYVDGKDCRTILDKCRIERRWIPPELCAFIMMHILRGLHTAHLQKDRQGRALNLIHRDVSPSNVICSYAGEVKLCDFGIAKATLSSVQTRSGVIKGKVKYMSPEQTMGKKLDPRSDIFSGGSVLYELLTRVPPFLAPNEMELIMRVRETKFTPVRERNPIVPPALANIVDTAMSRHKDDRYPTADAFADALQEFLEVHAKGISRSHLGRFVRKLFAEEIDRELRALEEWVVESASADEVGVNLIADELGPNADFSKFSPNPTAAADLAQERGVIEIESTDRTAEEEAMRASPTVILEKNESGMMARVIGEAAVVAEARRKERADGGELDLQAGHDDELSAEEAAQRLAALSNLPANLHDADTQILDLEEAADQAGSAQDPATLDPSFHERPTGEIERSDPALKAPGSYKDLHARETAQLEPADLVEDESAPRLATRPRKVKKPKELPPQRRRKRASRARKRATQELDTGDLMEVGSSEEARATGTQELDTGDLMDADSAEAAAASGTQELDGVEAAVMEADEPVATALGRSLTAEVEVEDLVLPGKGESTDQQQVRPSTQELEVDDLLSPGEQEGTDQERVPGESTDELEPSDLAAVTEQPRKPQGLHDQDTQLIELPEEIKSSGPGTPPSGSSAPGSRKVD